MKIKRHFIPIFLILAISLFTLLGGAKLVELPGSSQTLQLYSNEAGDDLVQLYKNAIESAKKSIALDTYDLNNLEIIQALQQKSNEGLSITIVSNARGFKDFAKYFEDYPVKTVKRAADVIMHQKILVIDEEKVLLGSANLNTKNLETDGNLVMTFENSALATILANKINSMDENHGSIAIPPYETTIGGQNVELWMLPEDTGALERIKTVIRSAKKKIQVAMYFLTNQGIDQELIEAYRRGVEVEIVIDASSMNYYTKKSLCNAGLSYRVWSGPGVLHHKLAIIDEEILVEGSLNWTYPGFDHNDECFMIVDSLTKEQLAKLNLVWSVITQNSEPACL